MSNKIYAILKAMYNIYICVVRKIKDKGKYLISQAIDFKRGLKEKKRKKKKYKPLEIVQENLVYYNIRKAIIKRHPNHIVITCPKNFCLVKNSKEFVLFLSTIEQCLKNKNPIIIDMQSVKDVEYNGLMVLFSVLCKFKKENVHFTGIGPQKKGINKKVIQSRFYNLIENNDKDVKVVFDNVDRIHNVSLDVKNKLLASEIMKKISIDIWGEVRLSRGAQTIINEASTNALEHGFTNEEKKFWHLSVKVDKKNRKAKFGIIDHGMGIINSLKEKHKNTSWIKKMWKDIQFIKPTKIIKDIFENETFMTSTHQRERGQGLLDMKIKLNENYISNLIVISNNVYANVQNKEYSDLGVDFSGTFVYFEVCYNNKSDKFPYEVLNKLSSYELSS